MKIKNGKVLCKSETVPGNTQSISKKRAKSRVLIVKSTFLRRISPAF